MKMAHEWSQVYEFRSRYTFSADTRKSRLIGALFPCLAGVGSAYQVLASAWDRRHHPPPGELVDIDGCPMHVQSDGEGAPTVVLETGLGGMSCAWAWIRPETAKFCRVFSYDRAGLGWSGEDPAPISARQTVRRLRSLLHKAGAVPPFVLAGHSMGGLLIRLFAHLYPADVAGMVLIDAVHPDQHLRSRAIAVHMRTGFRMLRAMPLLSQLGYVRLSGFFHAWADGLPAKEAAEARAFLSQHRHLRTTLDESLAWGALCEEVRRTGGLGNLPLAVVTAGKDVLPGQPELQSELAALSSDSVHVAVKGADHVTLVTHREYAIQVVEAIRHVAGRAQTLLTQR